MSGSKRKPGDDVGTDQDPTLRKKYRKAARTDGRVDAPTATNGEGFSFLELTCFANAAAAALQHAAPAVHSSMTPAGGPTAHPNAEKGAPLYQFFFFVLTNVLRENNMPAANTDKRPVRSS